MQAGFSQTGDGPWVLTTPTARVVHVCVNPRPGVGRILKPYVFQGWQPEAAIPAQTVTVSVSGNNVTIGGTISAGQGVAVSANGIAAGAAAGSTDTLSTLAASVAAALTAGGAASTATGPVITVPSATLLYVNTFVSIVTGKEVQRQIQGFDITLYAPGRDLRDAVSAAIQPVLGVNKRITMPDGFVALMDPAPPVETDDDKPEKALLFIRKLYYQVEFATVLGGTAATQAIIQDALQDAFGDTLATLVES
jgi:hypothetical protein